MKAVGTRDAGYYSKKFFAVYQTTVLDEQGSDCGSKKYRLYHLNFLLQYFIKNFQFILFFFEHDM